MNEHFTSKLSAWGKANPRNLPWIGVKDAYRIWLSEIILQQTRVEQGLPYYSVFESQFPDIISLAKAKDEEVMKLWEGLGYYSRARNMLKAARIVAEEQAGYFPKTYETIKALPGVGDYTAAAIASFAYGLPHAVVDGNVYRLLSRYFDLDIPIDVSAGKKAFQKLADSLLDIKNPGAWNQAMMDFGSQVCRPRNPDCLICPLQDQCQALIAGTISSRPLKSRKIKKKTRWFTFFVIRINNLVLVRKRTAKDVWRDLWEFPHIETTSAITISELIESEEYQNLFSNYNIKLNTQTDWKTQQLSHQTIHGRFIEISSDSGKLVEALKTQAFSEDNMRNLAYPVLIREYIG
ncbi:MAG: A/G-specific adenine glycosylase [Limisphaerales bacterium]|jgi:A/G-specific adenine glycosylase